MNYRKSKLFDYYKIDCIVKYNKFRIKVLYLLYLL